MKFSFKHSVINKLLFVFILTIFLAFNSAVAQTDTTNIDLFEMSLDELLNQEVDVAGSKAQNTREAPGLITIITREEIMESGARDLLDVFQLIPGIQVAQDVYGTFDLMMRGLLGSEGKILLMIDGQMQNELLYGYPINGNRLNVALIERIEMIRGPGSAKYGGFAELAVINIITQNAEKVNSVYASALYGQQAAQYGRWAACLGGGYKFNNGLQISGAIDAGENRYGTSKYRGLYGDTIDNHYNLSRPLNINLSAKYKGFEFRYIYSQFNNLTPEAYNIPVPNLNHLLNNDFVYHHAEIGYEKKIKKLTLNGRLNFNYQKPWRNDNFDKNDSINGYNAFAYFRLSAYRLTANLTASYDIRNNIRLMAGSEYFFDHGKNDGHDISNYFFDKDGNPVVTLGFHDVAGFAEVNWTNKIVNVVAGGRYEYHTGFGSAAVPRFALTKIYKNWHFKGLFSYSFRAPTLINLGYNSKITRELTRVIEFETGYQLGKKMFFSLSFFDIFIKDPIVYAYDFNSGIANYYNLNQTGSLGIEFEYRYKWSFGSLRAGYSFNYCPDNRNKVENYEVLATKNQLLGSAMHKATLSATFKLYKGLHLNVSSTILSQRYAITRYDADNDVYVQEKLNPTLLINANIFYNDLLVKGLDVNLSVYNLTNKPYQFIQPYNGGNAPMPGTGIEVLLRVGYRFDFSKNKKRSIPGGDIQENPTVR